MPTGDMWGPAVGREDPDDIGQLLARRPLWRVVWSVAWRATAGTAVVLVLSLMLLIVAAQIGTG